MNFNTAAALFSQPLQSDAEIEITGFCIDSRLVEPGTVFIALKGARVDGHDFVAQAGAKGALAAVVNRFVATASLPQWVVPDTLEALTQLAIAHRKTITSPIIALTGSNGKTTVKEMIAAILPAPSYATLGNLNNHIGAPLSVLQMNSQHRYAVLELGANHAGEIAHTASIVQPDVSLINNIAPAHVEGFGSIEGVARAKGEIYQSLSAHGTAVINDDDEYAHFWDGLVAERKVLRFSAKNPADVWAQHIRLNQDGCAQFSLMLPHQVATTIQLKVPGRHNVLNALAAAACCHALCISLENIQSGLESFQGVKGRMTLLKGKNNATIIDDTYNANLRSVVTGLEVLAQRLGKKIFVFGDMGELGSYSRDHHQQVGITAQALGIDMVLCWGLHSKNTAQAFGKEARHFSNQDELVESLINELTCDTTVLVKGSRSSAMEKIVHKLLN